MKNGDILKLYETLSRLSEDKNLRFGVKIGYLLAKNKAAIRNDAMLIYSERKKIMLEYGDVQDNGDIIVKKELVNEVQGKLDELMNIDVNVQITPLYLPDLERYELNIDDIEGLMPIIMEPIITGPPITE